MEDAYVYVSVKLYLKQGQTEDSIQEIVQEMDYSFSHDDITDHEITDIIDFQTGEEYVSEYNPVDVFDISDLEIDG